MEHSEGKLPGDYTQQEKIDAMWYAKNWSECLAEADGRMHGGIDSQGRRTGIRHAVCINPEAIEREAHKLMRKRGF